MLLSIIACMQVLYMRRKGAVLMYEPRRPVPWGAIGGILAMTFVAIPVISTFTASPGDQDASSQSVELSSLIAGMVVQLFLVIGFAAVIALFTKASLRDLGLPASIRQAFRDVGIGAAACLTALAPVLLLQQMLMHLLFPDRGQSGHPLIKTVMNAPPDPWILILSGVFAVVVAPVCEEITFRLLLQGWLERWEDARLGWRRKPTNVPVDEDSPAVDGETQVLSEPLNQPAVCSVVVDDTTSETDPPRMGIAGLPYGWLPIIVSAIMFGLAHFGYGPEPIPLFLLALVLGFLYQRTHRIIPSIVTHALFNLFSMILLWRMVYHYG